jgi:hypothetical protein
MDRGLGEGKEMGEDKGLVMDKGMVMGKDKCWDIAGIDMDEEH